MKTQQKNLLCSIDPGASGGIAFLRTNGTVESVHKMPKEENELMELLEKYSPLIRVAVLERVHSMPSQGVVSVWKFGQHYGFLRGVIATLRIPLELVQPERWQKELDIPKRGLKPQTAHKNVLKDTAQALFPKIKVTHAIGDALLICEWKRRQGG